MGNRQERDGKLDEMRGLALLRGCRQPEIRLFGRMAEVADVRAGVTLARQGELQRWCHVIAEGEASVVRDGRVVGTLGPGEAVGDAAALSHAPSPTTVVTAGPVRAYVLSAAQLADLVRLVPTVAHRLSGRLAQRVVDLEATVAHEGAARVPAALRLVPAG